MTSRRKRTTLYSRHQVQHSHVVYLFHLTGLFFTCPHVRFAILSTKHMVRLIIIFLVTDHLMVPVVAQDAPEFREYADGRVPILGTPKSRAVTRSWHNLHVGGGISRGESFLLYICYCFVVFLFTVTG